MANDRIYMKCRGCGETKMLAKYYPSNYGVWWPEEVCKWIEDHMKHSPNFGEMDLKGDRCFDLFTESDERFGELYQPPNKKPGLKVVS